MPQITVQAVVTGDGGVLLLRDPGASAWRLPGGPLLDSDADVDDALLRELAAQTGVTLDGEPLFLDTFFERTESGETVVHNLYHVAEPVDAGVLGVEHLWVEVDALADVNLPEWLREALRVAFGGEPSLPFDLAGIEGMMQPEVERAPVFILTGPAGAGKSTTARELCRRFPTAAHIDVDWLRSMIVSGYAAPVGLGGEPVESGRQAALAARNAASLARNCSAEGIVSVIDGVLETTDDLDPYVDALVGHDLYVITLLPDAATLTARDAGRDPSQRMGARCQELHGIIAANGETRGVRLDTTGLTVEDAVDAILERMTEAAVSPEWEMAE